RGALADERAVLPARYRPRQAIPRRGEGRRTDLAQGPSCARGHARLALQRDARSRRHGAGAIHARFPEATWLKRRTRSAKASFRPSLDPAFAVCALTTLATTCGVAGEARAGVARRAGLQ